MKIGSIIRRFRLERKMTLVELSKASGVALATLSRIENGKMTGTLESHMSIAEAFGLTIPELYKDLAASRKTVELQSRKARTDVFIHDNRSSSEMLASDTLRKKMMPILITIRKGGTTHKEETKPGIEKFLYVLEGKIEAVLGDERYALAKGDTLYFDASIPHYLKNSDTAEARAIAVTAPPAL